MSGHSKWSNIKRKKGAEDAKRSKLFSKITRLITVAARVGGPKLEANPTLRLAVEKAKEARVTKETIQKAIDKGAGANSGENFAEVIYEGYGPEGVAFYITGLTDNKNRTVAELRNIFSKHDGSLGTSGSTAYIFNPDPENPVFTIPVNNIDIAKKLLSLADTLEDNDDVQEVYSNFEFAEDIVAQLE